MEQLLLHARAELAGIGPREHRFGDVLEPRCLCPLAEILKIHRLRIRPEIIEDNLPILEPMQPRKLLAQELRLRRDQLREQPAEPKAELARLFDAVRRAAGIEMEIEKIAHRMAKMPAGIGRVIYICQSL